MSNKVKDRARQAAAQARKHALETEYKHKAALLKKKGILTSKVNARKNITRSTRTKINKFADVLEGRAIAIAPKRQTRLDYEDKGIFKAIGRHLIVPKAKEGTRVSLRTDNSGREYVRMVEPMSDKRTGLATGQFEKVVLPYKPADMQGLLQELRTDPTIDGLKRGDELFTFQIDGWSTDYNAADAEHLAAIIEVEYKHLFLKGSTRSVIKYLTLYRFKAPNTFVVPDHEHKGFKKKPGYGGGRSEDRHMRQDRLKSASIRNKRYEANVSPEIRAARLEKKRLASVERRATKKGN